MDNNKHILLLCASLFVATIVQAQNPSVFGKLVFEENFDNREYKITESKTIFGARLTPYLGVKMELDNSSHSLQAGVSVMKEFGAKGLIYNPSFWYNCTTQLGNTEFSLNCGIYPTSLLGEKFSTVFLSDESRWYGKYFQGMLLSFRKAKANYELGINWPGKYGSDLKTREKFVLFAAGHVDASQSIRLGYNFMMVHYANSQFVGGVVDNILGEIWAEYHLSNLNFLDGFSAKLGYIQAYQRNRLREQSEKQGIIPVSTGPRAFSTPNSLEFNILMNKWNVFVDNRLYYYQRLLPLYYCNDAADLPYGSNLYSGDPFFALGPEKTPYDVANVYDRFELSYRPQIADNLQLKASLIFHISNFAGLMGSQQIIGIVYNLNHSFKK